VRRDIVVSALTLIVGACRVDGGKLDDRLYACEPGIGEDQCGTDSSGRSMTCVPGDQLGGGGFCTATCDNPTLSSTGGDVCLSSHAKLPFCQPRPGDDRSSCPLDGLSCLRTDVLRDEGVCVAAPVCEQDEDCDATFPRYTCLGTLLRNLYGPGAGVATDHLYCVVEGCDAQGSACPAGEVCLPKVVARSSSPPDICVPKCDAGLNCPPNHFCYRKVSGPEAPAVCIPGLLGFGCTSDNDCLMGMCLSAGGIGICTVACTSDVECARFSDARGPFVCANVAADRPGGPVLRFCMNPVSFGGSPCASETDCDPGEVCTGEQPVLSPGEQPRECRLPCTFSAECAPRYGIVHACVSGTCFPGRFYVPCQGDGDCIPDMTCLEAPAVDSGPSGAPRTVCTYACVDDADCASHVLTERLARCEAGVCMRVRVEDTPCDRDDQCISGFCALVRPDRDDKRCE
jgi:hypothetical protein